MTIKNGQSQVHASGRGLDDAVGNWPGVAGSSLRVSGAGQDGAREFARRRSRLVGRSLRVVEKLAGSWEDFEVDVLGQGLEDAEGTRREFAKRFVEGIRKLARNMPGDHRWKDRETHRYRLWKLPDCGRFGLHAKKIDSGRWCASRRRTREWT
ncbi:hypothetical protein BHM03_00027433 [Ensete ventricosum]|nr:hypothetical protein BHM03_00027433 [Ensete ventricosum]